MTVAPRIDALPADLDEGSVDDLVRDADLDLLRFSGVVADELDLRGARLREVDLERVELPVVRAAGGVWRDVRVTGRIGSLEAYDAEWRSVQFVGCKLSFLNLRGAELLDVEFADCVIEELDLLDTKARRVRLAETRLGHLSVRDGSLQDVDLRGARIDAIDGVRHLRGATIGADQLLELAPLLADAIGLRVAD